MTEIDNAVFGAVTLTFVITSLLWALLWAVTTVARLSSHSCDDDSDN